MSIKVIRVFIFHSQNDHESYERDPHHYTHMIDIFRKSVFYGDEATHSKWSGSFGYPNFIF